jgi:hypothetical protein
MEHRADSFTVERQACAQRGQLALAKVSADAAAALTSALLRADIRGVSPESSARVVARRFDCAKQGVQDQNDFRASV